MGKKDYLLRNSQLFHDYYSRLKSIALSVFEWEGLPETCNARFLEDTLFHYGQAVFVEDKNMSYLNLKVTAASELNVYNEPTAYHAFSTGYNEMYAADECVIIRNNALCRSTESTIINYAERLAELEQAISINCNAQKTPILIKCDERTRKTLEVIYAQFDGNKPVIFASKGLEANPLEVLNTNAPFVADRLREEKRAVWNEALEFLGINTNPSDKKKERLIVTEVNANNEQIDIQFESMLAEREESCRKINEMFGLNVSVKKRVKEVVNSGTVHNGTLADSRETTAI